MTRPSWNYICYMVWIIKIYKFSPFSSQKFEKFHYSLCRLQTAITRVLLDTGCLHQTLGGQAINTSVVEICLRPTLIAISHANLLIVFEHEIGYNSSYTTDGRPTLVAMVTKIQNFSTKLAINEVM